MKRRNFLKNIFFSILVFSSKISYANSIKNFFNNEDYTNHFYIHLTEDDNLVSSKKKINENHDYDEFFKIKNVKVDNDGFVLNDHN